ncbi:MAG: MFS transporter [Solirubrobacterales bacterium]
MTAATRNRDLRIVAGAIAISSIGDWVAMIALSLRANELWHGAGVAVLLICLWAPLAVLAGHVGVLVDRVETRALAIWSAVFQAVVVCALAFAHSLAAILPLTVVLGAGVAVSQASEFALVPLLAGSREIGRANGLVESARSVGFMVGPLVGGALAAGAGVQIALFADAATFLVIAAALLALPVRRRIAQVPGGVKPRARDGLALLRGERVLAIVLGAGAVTLVFMSASIPGDFAYVAQLGHPEAGIGIVLSVWAIGMIAASNAIPHRIPVSAVAIATLLAAALQGFAKFIAPFWTVFWFMVVWWLIGGMGHGVKNTGFRTLIHQRVPPEQHGRAFAAFNGVRNTAELVALAAGGVLVTTVGARGTLWIAGGVSAVAALAGVVALSRRRGEEAVAAVEA